MVECVRPNLGMDIFVSVKQNPVYDPTYEHRMATWLTDFDL